ncbi:hypothetical protein BGZ63DRAFT_66115 [Mariannaea sp. PMI_226]|nr:hypothetical protein BGZ63DRAFT_66115 [Mariannaea sp. PMI_226]
MAGGLPIGLGLYGADFSQSVSTIDTSFVPTGKPAGLDNKPKMSSRLKGTPEIATSVLDSPSSKSSTVKESAKPTPEEPTSPIPSARPRTLPSRSRATSFAISPVSTMFVEDTAVQIQVLSRQAPKPIRLSGGKTQPEDVPPLPTPKWNFGLIKRQTGASDLSSISSGFGDGDIIITPNNTVATVNTAKLPVPPSPVANPSGDLSKSYRNRDSARDTQISIDPRPRFHSVSSWVKQQSGQVRQAQQQSGNTPPVPMLPPPEQELRYMMPDGEEPRRPEGV